MTPITRQDIVAHQHTAPWSAQHQIEQDLLLCRAMAALFGDAFLSGQVAMRGGTLLHKVHLSPASRYSEDIDLVAVGTRPEGHIRRTIRRVLADVLGAPKASVWDTVIKVLPLLPCRIRPAAPRGLRSSHAGKELVPGC